MWRQGVELAELGASLFLFSLLFARTLFCVHRGNGDFAVGLLGFCLVAQNLEQPFSDFIGIHPDIAALENAADLGVTEEGAANSCHHFFEPTAEGHDFCQLFITLAGKTAGIDVEHELAIVVDHQFVAG